MRPYYAVIFTNTLTNNDKGYGEMAQQMVNLAKKQSGFMDFESARDNGIGISVSYWESVEAISNWKANMDHQFAQQKGKETWYQWYKVRICLVEREYGFEK